MASLDDFFAKKDKRKKGKNKNFVTSEKLAKTIEEQATVTTQPPAEAESKVKIDLPAALTQEDEWKEEEEVVKDLEGLRVQKLDKDNSKEVESVQVKSEGSENVIEGGSSVPRESSGSSPWQTVAAPQTEADATAEDETEPVPETLPEKLPNVQADVYVPPASRGGGAYVPPGAREGGGGTYVPPHLKRGGAGGGAYVPPSRRGMGRGSKLPPDLSSAVAFPSLHNVSKKGDGSSSEKGTDFKEVQGPKTSRASDASYHAPGLELTNKFSGLEDDN